MKGTYFSITKEHDIISDKKLVHCPNLSIGCQLLVERGKTKQHMSVCEFTEVACAYESLGCGVKMMRKDIEKHEANVSVAHFQMMDKIVKLQSEMLREQSKSLHLLENECQKVSRQHQDLLQKYNKLSLKYKTLSEKHSKLFPVVKLLSERAMSMSKHHFTLLEGESFQFKLSQYASKKEKNEIFLFAPFNTHPDGYKLQVGIYANGCGKGKGTHLSLSTEKLKNDNDHKLQNY